MAQAAIGAGAETLLAKAQEENITVTITFPKANITVFPSISVNAYYVGPSTLRIEVSCFTIVSECPPVTIYVGWNGTTQYMANLTWECMGPVCKWYQTVEVGAESSFVVYEYTVGDTTVRNNITVTYVELLPGIGGYVLSILPFAIIAGLMARGDLVLAGFGGIAAGIILYVMGVVGFVPLHPYLYLMAIVVGAILVWEGARR